jgi:hypothetical protein
MPFNGISALEEMSEYSIEAVNVNEGTGDLSIVLGGLFTLEVLSTSAGYENWNLYHSKIGEVIAQGGEFHLLGQP